MLSHLKKYSIQLSFLIQFKEIFNWINKGIKFYEGISGVCDPELKSLDSADVPFSEPSGPPGPPGLSGINWLNATFHPFKPFFWLISNQVFSDYNCLPVSPSEWMQACCTRPTWLLRPASREPIYLVQASTHYSWARLPAWLLVSTTNTNANTPDTNTSWIWVLFTSPHSLMLS